MPTLSEIKKKILTPGIVGQYVHGASTTLGYVMIEKSALTQDSDGNYKKSSIWKKQ